MLKGLTKAIQRAAQLNLRIAKRLSRDLGAANHLSSPNCASDTRPEESPDSLQFVPPGHFYSPIPSLREVSARSGTIFSWPADIPGVDLRKVEQRELLESFVPYYDQMPFTPSPREGYRYHFENPTYTYADGIFLYCMLRHLEPKRLVEVGSGYSSALTLDTNEQFLNGAMDVTLIEPYPDMLHRLLRRGDRDTVSIHTRPVQDVPAHLFSELQANDVLFIDSTHVSKAGSDVNRLILDVLPRLNPGVYVHFHDIFYPFEYPREWIFEGRTWTEGYLLRAFLAHNDAFEIVLFSNYIVCEHADFFASRMPLCQRNPGGSIWLRRRR